MGEELVSFEGGEKGSRFFLSENVNEMPCLFSNSILRLVCVPALVRLTKSAILQVNTDHNS